MPDILLKTFFTRPGREEVTDSHFCEEEEEEETPICCAAT